MHFIPDTLKRKGLAADVRSEKMLHTVSTPNKNLPTVFHTVVLALNIVNNIN